MNFCVTCDWCSLKLVGKAWRFIRYNLTTSFITNVFWIDLFYGLILQLVHITQGSIQSSTKIRKLVVLTSSPFSFVISFFVVLFLFFTHTHTLSLSHSFTFFFFFFFEKKLVWIFVLLTWVNAFCRCRGLLPLLSFSPLIAKVDIKLTENSKFPVENVSSCSCYGFALYRRRSSTSPAAGIIHPTTATGAIGERIYVATALSAEAVRFLCLLSARSVALHFADFWGWTARNGK